MSTSDAPNVREIWDRIEAGFQPTRDALCAARDNLRKAAVNALETPFCKDLLERVARLDEAERQLSDGLLTLRAQLVHLHGSFAPEQREDLETILPVSPLIN